MTKKAQTIDKKLLDQLDEFVSLFEERDNLYEQATNKILDFVESTVLTALHEVLGVPKEDIGWMEVQLFENLLLLVCTVAYDGKTKASPIVEQLAPAPPGIEGTPHARIIRIGVPLGLIFSAPEEIVEFLKGEVEKQFPSLKEQGVNPDPTTEPGELQTEETPPPITPDGFDAAELSREQVEQLLLIRHALPRTKQ